MKQTKQNKLKKNKKTNGYFYLIILLVIILGITVILNIYLNSQKPLETQEINVKATVGDHVGIFSTSEELNFGTVIPENPASKAVVLRNEYSFPVEVKVTVSPELKTLLYGEESFYISEEDVYNYMVTFYPTQNSSFGNYSGKITFNFYPA